MRYLRVAKVYTKELRLDDVQEVGCTPQELEKTALEVGDILIVEGNGSLDQIGRLALWDASIPGCSHRNHLIRARARSNFVPECLLYWMPSPLGREYIERVASPSSGLHTLSIRTGAPGPQRGARGKAAGAHPRRGAEAPGCRCGFSRTGGVVRIGSGSRCG